MHRLAALVVLLLAPAIAAAAADATFDVASLKPSPPAPGDTININLGTIRGGTVTLGNASLADCIKFAYGLSSNDQIGGPDWVKDKSVRFDVVGKAPSETPREQLLLMLRSLLSERFHLAIHTEARRFTHLSIVVAKGGPKLREVQADPAATRMSYRIGHLDHNQISMQTFAMLLSRQMRQLVVDETGLKGVYELKLDWSPETGDSGSTIYTAIQEQLGLKLQSSKEPIDVYVIDHADRTPVAN